MKKHFVDGIHAEKDDGEIGFFWDMYPNSLELKVEHQIDHVTFLNLDKNIKEGTFIYKLFVERFSFLVSIMRMPHIEINITTKYFF